MNIKPIDRELGQACIEAFRRARSNNKRKSAAPGSSINLRENQTVNTHTNQLPTLRETYDRAVEAYQQLGLSESSARRAVAGRDGEFLRLVQEEESSTALQEAQARGDIAKANEISEQRIVEALKDMGYDNAVALESYEPGFSKEIAAKLREGLPPEYSNTSALDRLEAQQRPSREEVATIEADMADSFQLFGYSESAAKRMARGR